MAEYLKVEDIKEAVMECPVCVYIFDSEERSPRLMPCCVSSVCSKCLADIIARAAGASFDCPLCRKSHDSVKSETDFPLERVMLKMMEYLKVQKGQKLPCTDCPDSETAEARCKDCGLFLCRECLSAHKRNGITREHKTVSFEEIKNQSIQSFNNSHHCSQHKMNPLQFYCRKCDKIICVSCTVIEHKEVNGHEIISLDQICEERVTQADSFITRLDDKIRDLGSQVETTKKKRKNLATSKHFSKKQVEMTFDDLIEELRRRRDIVMTEVDTRFEVHDSSLNLKMKQTESLISRVASASEYIRHVRSTADEIESIQLFSRVKHVLHGILEEELVSDDWIRKGLGFDPTGVRDLMQLVPLIGLIKTITYMDDQLNDEAHSLYIQPSEYPAALQNLVTVCGHETLEVPGTLEERTIVLQQASVDGRPAVIKCPRLQFDNVCLSRDCVTSENGTSLAAKLQKSSSKTDTGCRLKVGRRAMVSSPFGGTWPQFWQMRLKLKVKTPTTDNSMIFEAALSPKPVDAAFAQPSGYSLNISNCDIHNQLCLKIRHDGQLKADVPVILNEPGVEGDLDLGFLFEPGKKVLHQFDMTAKNRIVTIQDFDISLPHWMIFYVDTPEESDMEVKLVSGAEVRVNETLVQLLKNVY